MGILLCSSLVGACGFEESVLIPSFARLFLLRCCDCRGRASRRLLDDLQPQLACLPSQRFDLLLPHLGLVVLLTLTHVRHAMLQRQIDDPCQLVRRRRQGRLNPQPPFHPPQEPSQGSLAVVKTLRRQTQRLRRTVHPPTGAARLDPATALLPIGTQPQPASRGRRLARCRSRPFSIRPPPVGS